MGSKLDFGFWDAIPHTNDVADDFEAHIALAQQIERLGWHSYFVIEHQNAPQGTSSPNVFLTAVARETSTLRLGAMMWQLPFYNPMRLAQDVATLDQLSRGRVEFGSGIGVHEHEFIRWGIDYYQRAAISEEVLQVVKMAWTQNEVTFDGKFFHYDEAFPYPKPYQQPHPPIWAAAHSDTSFEFAARNNYGAAKNLDTDDVVAGKFDLYRRVWRASGHPGEMPGIFLMRSVHVAPTDVQAHEEARQFLVTGGERIGGGPIAQTRIGWGSHARGMGRDSERADNAARGQTMREAVQSYEFSIDNGLAIVGSPDTVIRRIQASQERLGYTLLCTNHQIGRMPADMVSRSIELFGNEVIPAFSTAPVTTR